MELRPQAGPEQRFYPWSVPPYSQVLDSRYAVYGCQLDGGFYNAADLPNVGSRSPKVTPGRDNPISREAWSSGPSTGARATAWPAPIAQNLAPDSARTAGGGEWRTTSGLMTAAGDSAQPTYRNAADRIRCARDGSPIDRWKRKRRLGRSPRRAWRREGLDT